MYKFLAWIDVNKIDWYALSINNNEKVIYILEENFGKINWKNLSRNINAIHVLEKNIDKIHWDILSLNINAQECIEKIYFFYSLRRVVVNRKVETFLYTPQQYIY